MMDREDTIEKEQAGEERARTQVLRAQESGTKYESTMETLRQAEQEMPSFSGSYDDEIGRLYDRIINREGFRYDMNSDPLYMSYRDRYTREGRLAMKSTMGQAAALTGGYGSSYSQAVGQEQYGAYLEKLGNVMPQLYSAAYSRYKSEGDALSEKYAMAVKRGESEYNRYRDRLSDAKAQQELGYKLEQQDYERQQKAFQTLMSLISSTGYEANEDDLKQSGMSQAQADAIRNEFLRKNGLLDTGGTSSGAWYGGYASKEQTKLDANEKKSSSGKNRRT
ncbi:MAG: hypothetical protein V8S87_05830 [Oscillospiraceae bacterium]